MKTETCRLVADWLAHVTYGINARLLAMPLVSGVTRAAAVTLFDETRHKEIARGQLPESFPCVAVSLTDAPMVREAQFTYPQAPGWMVEIAVRYGIEKTDTHIAGHHESQVIRAIDWSLTQLLCAPVSDNARVLNDVQIIGGIAARAEQYKSNDDARVEGAVMYGVRVRDRLPIP